MRVHFAFPAPVPCRPGLGVGDGRREESAEVLCSPPWEGKKEEKQQIVESGRLCVYTYRKRKPRCSLPLWYRPFSKAKKGK